MDSHALLKNTEMSLSPLPSVPSGDIDGSITAWKPLKSLEGSPWHALGCVK